MEVPGDLKSHDYHRNHHQRLHNILVIVLLISALYKAQPMIIIIILLIVKTTRSQMVEAGLLVSQLYNVMSCHVLSNKTTNSRTVTLTRWWETQQSRCSQAEMSTASSLPGSLDWILKETVIHCVFRERSAVEQWLRHSGKQVAPKKIVEIEIHGDMRGIKRSN